MSTVRPYFLERLKSWVGVSAETTETYESASEESGSWETDTSESYESFESTCDSCDYAEHRHKRSRLESDAECENASLKAVKCSLIRENTILDTRLQKAAHQYRAKEREAEYSRLRCQEMEDAARKHCKYIREDIEVHGVHDILLSARKVNSQDPAHLSLSARYRDAHLQFEEELAIKEQQIAELQTQNRAIASQWLNINSNYNAAQLKIQDLENQAHKLKGLYGSIQELEERRNSLKMEVKALERYRSSEETEPNCFKRELEAAAAAELAESQLNEIRGHPEQFKTLDLAQRSNFELCLAAVRGCWRNLIHCSPAMRNNRDVVSAALEQDTRAYSWSGKGFQHNYDNALMLLQMYPAAVGELPWALHSSAKFKQLVASHAPKALDYWDEESESETGEEDEGEDEDEDED